MWLGDHDRAAEQATQAARQLADVDETDHSAFWRYVEAHALYGRGRAANITRAKTAIRDAIANGPWTAWFVRLTRNLEELEGRDPASLPDRGDGDAQSRPASSCGRGTMPKASCRSVPCEACLERFGVLKRSGQFSLA